MISILIAILVFSVLVIVHELGHFYVAKKSGILVEEFSVGLGPIIFAKKIGETVYSVRAFPLGGSCRMLGEDAECKDERSFQSKSVWARIAVVVAGPLMNFVLALILLFFLISTSYVMQPVVSEVMPAYPAAEVGLQEGDRITKINDNRVHVYEDFQVEMAQANGAPIEVEVQRGDARLVYQITPERSTETGGLILGFRPVTHTGIFAKAQEGYERAGIGETVKNSFDTMVFYVRYTVVSFGKMLTSGISKDDVSGPVGIVKLVGQSYEMGIKESVLAAIQNIAYLGALLSANLGVLNLFPIPALDGGRLVFLLVEAIRRKPMNQEIEGRVHFAGFMLLIALMLVITYNDISRLFTG